MAQTEQLPWPDDIDRDLAASVFKAYDIRGIADAPLTPSFSYRLGRSLATHLGWQSAAVGCDIRESGPALHEALLNGLKDGGVMVHDLGIVPTGVMYLATNVMPLSGGVMVTASHNPPEYNGFKMNRRTAAMAGQELQDLKDVFLGTEFVKGPGAIREMPDFQHDTYLAEIIQKVEEPARRVSVVIDPANAVPGPALAKLMRIMGVDAVELNCEWDNTYPNHPPDPTRPANMVQLAQKVKEVGAEFGIGIDGDGDRIGVVDQEGRFIHPDRLLALFATDLLANREFEVDNIETRQVIYDVKCSMSLENAIKKAGGVPIMMRTGHSFLKQALRDAPLTPLAGEMSGHFFFNDNWYGFDDALYATARLVELVSRNPAPVEGGPTFSDLFAEMDVFPSTGEAKVPCPDDEKESVMQKVEAAFSEFGYEFSTVDGIRARFEGKLKGFESEGGWYLCRQSNTEPILVMRAEGTSEGALEAIKQEVQRLLGHLIDLELFLED